jgi:hypothetical protein
MEETEENKNADTEEVFVCLENLEKITVLTIGGESH